jgi:Ulp1 family protease
LGEEKIYATFPFRQTRFHEELSQTFLKFNFQVENLQELTEIQRKFSKIDVSINLNNEMTLSSIPSVVTLSDLSRVVNNDWINDSIFNFFIM